MSGGLRAASPWHHVTPELSSGFVTSGPTGPIRPTEIPKGKNKHKTRSAGKEIPSTLEKKAAGIKREKVCWATHSPTSTPLAARKGTLAAIPELHGFPLGEEVEGITEGLLPAINVRKSTFVQRRS